MNINFRDQSYMLYTQYSRTIKTDDRLSGNNPFDNKLSLNEEKQSVSGGCMKKRMAPVYSYIVMNKLGKGLIEKEVSLKSQILSDVRAVENQKYSMQISDEMEGFFNIYDKRLDKNFTFDPANTSLQKDILTGKKYLIQTDSRNGFINAIKVNDDLANTINEFMGTKNILDSTLGKYAIAQDSFTGIESLKVKGSEGKGSCMMISNQEEQNKLQELAAIYRQKYPNLVSDELAIGMAIAEVNGFANRTENGILMVSSDGMEYMDEKNSSKGWGIKYDADNGNIYIKIRNTINSDILGKNLDRFSNWNEIFEKEHINYKRIWSDEELE